MQQIVFIETAMPSALLGAVFAKHYNCKPELVSMAVMVTLILSVLSVSALFLWLF
jgi:predicted permease